MINLYPYDAGTEEGTEFTLSNPATNPHEPISSIRNTGKFSNSPMATLTFTLKSTTPPPTTAPGTPEALIALSPSDLVFFVAMVGDAPAAQKLQVRNGRPGSMPFNVSDNSDWLTLDPLSGSSSGPSNVEETDEEDRTYAASSLMSVITLALAIEMNYDANRDGRIDRDEVITAIIDYFAGRIDRDRVLRVIQRYFSSQ